MSDIPILVRHAEESDLAFVFATWLKSFHRFSFFAKKIEARIFYAEHHRVIERLIERPSSRIFVASPEGDPRTILGYLAVDRAPDGRATIHFAYTKSSFRRLGVMRRLLEESKVNPDEALFSHWTFTVDHLLARWPKARYCPYF